MNNASSCGPHFPEHTTPSVGFITPNFTQISRKKTFEAYNRILVPFPRLAAEDATKAGH